MTAVLPKGMPLIRSLRADLQVRIDSILKRTPLMPTVAEATPSSSSKQPIVEDGTDWSPLNLYVLDQSNTPAVRAANAQNGLPVKPGQSLLQILEQLRRTAALNPFHGMLHYYAGLAWNLDAFSNQFEAQKTTRQMDEAVASIEGCSNLKAWIGDSFGSPDELFMKFTKHALSVVGSGWTWLMVENSNEKDASYGMAHIVNTYNGDTPLFHEEHVKRRISEDPEPTGSASTRIMNMLMNNNSTQSSFNFLEGVNKLSSSPYLSGPLIPQHAVPKEPVLDRTPLPWTPILCVNMCEHAFIGDFGWNRREYLRHVLSNVNWKRSEELLKVSILPQQ